MPGTKSSERPSSCNKVTDAHAHQTTCSSPASPDHTLPQRSRRSGTIPERWPRMPRWTSARLFPRLQNRIHILLRSAPSFPASLLLPLSASFLPLPHSSLFFIPSSPSPSFSSVRVQGVRR